MDDKEIKKILSFLLKEQKKDPGRPIESERLVKELEIDLNTLSFSIEYLEGKGYVKVYKYLGREFDCKISALGIDKITE